MFSNVNMNRVAPAGIPPKKLTPSVPENRNIQQNFDMIEISSRLTKEEKQVLDLQSTISREVRTRPAQAELAALREQVKNGTYRPNPQKIASAMLLMREEGAVL